MNKIEELLSLCPAGTVIMKPDVSWSICLSYSDWSIDENTNHWCDDNLEKALNIYLDNIFSDSKIVEKKNKKILAKAMLEVIKPKEGIELKMFHPRNFKINN